MATFHGTSGLSWTKYLRGGDWVNEPAMRITQFVPATRMLIIVMAHMTVRHTQIGVAVLLEQVFARQVSILVATTTTQSRLVVMVMRSILR